jgi:DNA-binding CsgD family transcriptional regulator
MTFTCVLLWVLALICLPILIILHLTETKKQRINRWRKSGKTWKTIAAKLNCSQTTARRWAIA